MGLACIIEDELPMASQIETAIKEIDGQLDILKFKDLEGFYLWFSKVIQNRNSEALPAEASENPATAGAAVTETPPAPTNGAPASVQSSAADSTTPAAPTASAAAAATPATLGLKLIVADIKFLGPRYFSLIEKVKRLMVRRSVIPSENDLAIILTAYDSPNLNFKQIEQRIITNVIFKPFDRPILKQHLQIALALQKAVTDFVVFNQKIKAKAEMLKEVHLEAFTELGFTTQSYLPLNMNAVSKYYGKHFEAPGSNSVMALCTSCTPHPSLPGLFRAEFQYLGMNNAQVKKLRLALFAIEHDKVQKKSIYKKFFEKLTKKNKSPSNINFLSFGEEAQMPSGEFRTIVEDQLSNIEISNHQDIPVFVETLLKGSPKLLGNRPIHGLVLNADHVMGESSMATWVKVQEQIEIANRQHLMANPKPKMFILGDKPFSEAQLREWHQIVTDTIYLPIDQSYLKKRMLSWFPDVKPTKDSIEILSSATNEIIRVANPIEISSLSEACLTMKYYRPISFHGFRRFCLPSEPGSEVQEILASCYFSEKKENEYINHFVFFGITDKYLKYIRRWILESYIASKDPAA